jgi:hypothetical protein
MLIEKLNGLQRSDAESIRSPREGRMPRESERTPVVLVKTLIIFPSRARRGKQSKTRSKRALHEEGGERAGTAVELSEAGAGLQNVAAKPPVGVGNVRHDPLLDVGHDIPDRLRILDVLVELERGLPKALVFGLVPVRLRVCNGVHQRLFQGEMIDRVTVHEIEDMQATVSAVHPHLFFD